MVVESCAQARCERRGGLRRSAAAPQDTELELKEARTSGPQSAEFRSERGRTSLDSQTFIPFKPSKTTTKHLPSPTPKTQSTSHENICMMTTYVRNGKLILEIVDGRTVDIMRGEKQQDEGNIQ